MADIVPAAVRSRMMASITGKNTRPELVLRHGLHAMGFRFRLHDRRLPGKPDIVFPRYRAVVFAHGCFWHGHDCHLFKVPATRTEFWQTKIARNREIDESVKTLLAELGWRRAVVWECALKGRARLPLNDVLASCAQWLKEGADTLQIRGAS